MHGCIKVFAARFGRKALTCGHLYRLRTNGLMHGYAWRGCCIFGRPKFYNWRSVCSLARLGAQLNTCIDARKAAIIAAEGRKKSRFMSIARPRKLTGNSNTPAASGRARASTMWSAAPSNSDACATRIRPFHSDDSAWLKDVSPRPAPTASVAYTRRAAYAFVRLPQNCKFSLLIRFKRLDMMGRSRN
jgi:hypothetical protein